MEAGIFYTAGGELVEMEPLSREELGAATLFIPNLLWTGFSGAQTVSIYLLN